MVDKLCATIAANAKEIAALVAAIAREKAAHTKARAATAKEIAATVAAIVKDNDAHTKAQCKLFAAAKAMATSPLIAANATAISHPTAANVMAITTMAELRELVAAMATSHPIAANTTAFSHPMVAVSKENNIPPSHGTRDGHAHATGGIVPAVNSSDLTGVASTAVLSLPARVITSRSGIVPSIQSLPTANGLSNNVATAMLRIKEVWAHQDAHLEAFMD